MFLDVIFADVAEAAGDHDRLVIAAHFNAVANRNGLLITAEISAQCRAAEFVVERRAANRSFEHDVERRNDAERFAVMGVFPGLQITGHAQVRHGETVQTGFRFRATSGRTFVADLAAGTG